MDMAVSSMQAGGPSACSDLYPCAQHLAHIRCLARGNCYGPSLAPCGWMPREPACWLLITQLCEKPLPLWTDGGAGAKVPTMFLESLLRDHSARPDSCPHPSPSSSEHLLSITSRPGQSWEAGTVTSWLAAIHPSCVPTWKGVPSELSYPQEDSWGKIVFPGCVQSVQSQGRNREYHPALGSRARPLTLTSARGASEFRSGSAVPPHRKGTQHTSPLSGSTDRK